MMKRFETCTVLITGAAGGMGRAFAEHFAKEGAELILTDIDEAGLKETVNALQAASARCASYRVDLADEADILSLAEGLRAEYKKLDVLINNAGLAYGEVAHEFASLSQAKWLRFLSINSVAPLLLAQALRELLAVAPGVVINISSMASYMPATAYGVTKATLNAMTFGMAAAFGGDGIRVNAIAPGLMETPAAKTQLPPGTIERVRQQQMLKLEGSADDIAALAAFLASSDARFITNEVVSCDAGNFLRGWRN